METKGEFSRAHSKSGQTDDSGKSMPSGKAPVLRKANPSSSISPSQKGYTTSRNQVTTSGK